MNSKKLMTVAALLLVNVLVNQECQAQQPAAAPAPAAQAAAPAPTAVPTPPAVDGVKVVAKFTGTAPVMGKLKREADPFCGKTAMTDQEVVVNPNGTLKNVAVRVSQGATPSATPPAEAIEIDQTNCMYTPRVLVGVTGQKMLIHNSDPIMHNVHSYTGTATGFNQAQMKGSKSLEKIVPAGVTKFKCDVHPWMTGYIMGNDNPYVCVTDDKGECTLKGVPAGSYTIETWHEKYGVKTATVTVTAGQPAAAEVSYAAQ